MESTSNHSDSRATLIQYDDQSEPCKVSSERFNQINAIKYRRELTKQEKMDFLGYKFYHSLGYNPDFDNPHTFTEKLNWLKIFYQNPKMRTVADKSLFPHYIKTVLPDFSHHLVPQLAVFNSVSEFVNIHFARLPWKFIAKSNFGSGAQEFVNKTFASMGRLRNLVQGWLNPLSNHYYHALENCYQNIKPSVICEQIVDIDYCMDFFCFNGEPLFYWIIKQPKNGERNGNIYRINGERIAARWHYPNFETDMPQSPWFDELLHCARVLSRNFPHVRVDFNLNKNTWYFSEMTFYSWAGLTAPDNPDFDLELGSHIRLENIKCV